MRASTVALVLLGLAVLLPQGIGFRLPQGLLNLDLPRLAMVALVALFFLRTLGSGRLAINGAPRTLTLLLLLAAWQLVSALASEAPGASLVRAIGNALTIWLFAFAFISLAGADSQRPRVVKTLTIIGILLAAWSIFELVTQTKLFPHRNIWEGDELLRFSTTLRRVYPSLDIQLPYMSIGPYGTNLLLAGALCALGGFLLVRGRKSRAMYLAGILLFTLAVVATQSRAGIAAALAMVLVSVSWGRLGVARFFPLMIVVGIVAIGWLGAGEESRQVLSASARLSDLTLGGESTGSVARRVAGLGLLLQQFDQWWLWGFGPGSLFDSDRVVTSVQIFSDQGSFFSFFVESGLLAGLLLTCLVLMSVLDGIRAADWGTRAATLGLIGFAITALVTVTPGIWGLALVLAGLVESWSRAARVVPAAARTRALATAPPSASRRPAVGQAGIPSAGPQ